MAALQFKDEPPEKLEGWYWMRHKDSDVVLIGHLVQMQGRPVMLYEAGELAEENFHHYLFAGPLEPPAEKSLGVQMAVEADDNRLLTPKDMLKDVLAAMDDPADVLRKINKAIFIGLFNDEQNYSTATLRSNLTNSEAIALLTIKANQFARDFGDND